MSKDECSIQPLEPGDTTDTTEEMSHTGSCSSNNSDKENSTGNGENSALSSCEDQAKCSVEDKHPEIDKSSRSSGHHGGERRARTKKLGSKSEHALSDRRSCSRSRHRPSSMSVSAHSRPMSSRSSSGRLSSSSRRRTMESDESEQSAKIGGPAPQHRTSSRGLMKSQSQSILASEKTEATPQRATSSRHLLKSQSQSIMDAKARATPETPRRTRGASRTRKLQPDDLKTPKLSLSTNLTATSEADENALEKTPRRGLSRDEQMLSMKAMNVKTQDHGSVPQTPIKRRASKASAMKTPRRSQSCDEQTPSIKAMNGKNQEHGAVPQTPSRRRPSKASAMKTPRRSQSCDELTPSIKAMNGKTQEHGYLPQTLTKSRELKSGSGEENLAGRKTPSRGPSNRKLHLHSTTKTAIAGEGVPVPKTPGSSRCLSKANSIRTSKTPRRMKSDGSVAVIPKTPKSPSRSQSLRNARLEVPFATEESQHLKTPKRSSSTHNIKVMQHDIADPTQQTPRRRSTYKRLQVNNIEANPTDATTARVSKTPQRKTSKSLSNGNLTKQKAGNSIQILELLAANDETPADCRHHTLSNKEENDEDAPMSRSSRSSSHRLKDTGKPTKEPRAARRKTKGSELEIAAVCESGGNQVDSDSKRSQRASKGNSIRLGLTNGSQKLRQVNMARALKKQDAKQKKLLQAEIDRKYAAMKILHEEQEAEAERAKLKEEKRAKEEAFLLAQAAAAREAEMKQQSLGLPAVGGSFFNSAKAAAAAMASTLAAATTMNPIGAAGSTSQNSSISGDSDRL